MRKGATFGGLMRVDGPFFWDFDGRGRGRGHRIPGFLSDIFRVLSYVWG